MASQLEASKQFTLGPLATGTSYLSHWSRSSRSAFLDALKADDAQDWIIVLGNEGADLDSLVSAMTHAFTLWHDHANPQKAVALLQRERDALRLRPENAVALEASHMSSEHSDILALDDLPPDLPQVARNIQGFVLVDHNTLRSPWEGDDKVVGIIDHHVDRRNYLDAQPRIIELTDSCSTLVANEMLARKLDIPLPKELADLLLRTIAIDSDDFKHGEAGLDHRVAARLFAHSTFAKHSDKLNAVMKRLDNELSDAKGNLSHMSVFDLLRRDWKGDVIESNTTDKAVHLGFASIPLSLQEQIERTSSNTTTEWFDIETEWTLDIRADVTVALNSFRDAGGNKGREIVLVVKATHRLSQQEALSLFQLIVKRVEESSQLQVSDWKGDPGQSGHKRQIWINHSPKAGRKIVRPVIEAAVNEWLQ